MKEFLKNVLIISVVVGAFLFVTFRNVETIWEPMRRTGGSGTQAVGESDLVLPGGGVEVAMAQELPTNKTEEENGMTDAEKLALIDKMLADAFEYSISCKEPIYEGVLLAINAVVEFGGVAVG